MLQQVIFGDMRMKATQEEANERYAAYKDAEVAHLLIKLTETDGELKPTYDTTKGYTYPEVEQLIGKNSADTDKLLQRLTNLGILERKVSDMALYCPACGKANISTNYTCPFCSSPQIIRNSLIEHLSCGYIDNMPKFQVDNEMVCPKCKKAIKKPADYRSAGKWYECGNCGKRVGNVQTTHTCRECQEKFDFSNARYLAAYNYTISGNSKDDINKGAIFAYFAEKLFASQGHQIQVPGKITGRSGIQQEFEILIALKDGQQLAIDPLFSSEPVDKLQIIKEYGKITDAQAQTYIIAESFSEDAKKLIKTYNLKVIEAKPAQALNELEKAIFGNTLKKAADKDKEKTPNPRLGGLFKKKKP